MPITRGAHHLALFTPDLDRLIAFYTKVFDAEVRLYMTEPGPGGQLRHAMIDLGGGFALHPFQMPHATGQEQGSMRMGDRGHLDHLCLAVADESALQAVRRRLVEAGASDGTITDFGAMRLVTFADPDGMEGEVGCWTGKAEALSFENRIREPWAAAGG